MASSLASMVERIASTTINEKNHKGSPKRYRIEGAKNMATDRIGMTALEELKQKYINRPIGDRKMLRLEINKLYDILSKQGRLFRHDGTPIITRRS